MSKIPNEQKRIIFLQSSLFCSESLGKLDRKTFDELQEKLAELDIDYRSKNTGIVYEDTLNPTVLSRNISKIINKSRSVPIKKPDLERKLEILKPLEQVFVVVDNFSKGYTIPREYECNHIDFQKLYLHQNFLLCLRDAMNKYMKNYYYCLLFHCTPQQILLFFFL